MGAVVAIFFMAVARYIFSNPHDGAAFFTRPFYDPQLWNSKAVLAATSIAVLTHDPKLDDLALMEFVRGPDFPTGGQLLNSKVELRQIYKEGAGTIRVLSRWSRSGERVDFTPPSWRRRCARNSTSGRRCTRRSWPR